MSGTKQIKSNNQAKIHADTNKHKGPGLSFIIAGGVIVLILAIIGVSYYFSEDSRYKRMTVINVDDNAIKMDYFLDRTRQANGDPIDILQLLTNEVLLNLAAPSIVGEVTESDIDQQLKTEAKGENETISDVEYAEWYRQKLNELGISEDEFRKQVVSDILGQRMLDYVGAQVPTSTEHVLLYQLVTATLDDANNIKSRIANGEDFFELSNEYTQSDSVSEVGWVPRGVLTYGFDDVVFNLDIGEVSEPVPYTDVQTAQETGADPTTVYFLLMVTEKDPSRALNESNLGALKADALDNWFAEEMANHTIEWHGITGGGFDNITSAWVNMQVSKNSSSTSTTSSQ